jgi:hypothetical protein
MTLQQQQALDALYALDNVVTIKITMSQGDWDAVRTEQPKGGICNFEWDRRRPVHVAKGRVGRDLGNELSRPDDVHRRGRQEEVVLRLTQQRKAVPAH